MAKDFYSILGIDRNASNDEIKSAFRKLAHKYHPDKNQNDKEAEQKFKEINEAYQTLSDAKKKEQYDRFGSTDQQGGFGGFGGFGASSFDGFDFGNVGDIFSDFFGGGFGGGRNRVRRGQDTQILINITLKESYFGVQKNFTLPRTGECIDCTGTGAKKGSDVSTCGECHGAGIKSEQRRTVLGVINTQVECKTCFGKGKVPKEKCPKCKGKGILDVREEIQLSIPAGIENGSVMAVQGKGEAITGGISGDLHVHIQVDSDKIFKRKGLNLTRVLSIKLTDALLGADIEVDTFDGKDKIVVPIGTNHGDTITTRGKGFSYGGRRGDIEYTIAIEIPKKLSSTTKKLVEELKKEGI